MVETALPTKTKIKRKSTIEAMIVIATIIAFPLAANKIAFAAVATITPTAVPTMLKLTSAQAPVVIPLVKGLYDRKDILLITTEVSDKAMKDQIGNFTGSPVNYAANLTQSQDIGIYGFSRMVSKVLDSWASKQVWLIRSHTPLWKVSIVEWKTSSGTTPTILGSDDAIAQAASKGQIIITPTKVVVNCPILQWGGNKDNTIPAGHT
jgi:hypothetical protein